MSDNLEALSVEKLNFSMTRAVSAGFVPHDTMQKHRLTNVLPGEKNNVLMQLLPFFCVIQVLRSLAPGITIECSHFVGEYIF